MCRKDNQDSQQIMIYSRQCWWVGKEICYFCRLIHRLIWPGSDLWRIGVRWVKYRIIGLMVCILLIRIGWSLGSRQLLICWPWTCSIKMGCLNNLIISKVSTHILTLTSNKKHKAQQSHKISSHKFPHKYWMGEELVII